MINALTGTDHKVVSLRIVVAAAVFLVLAGLLALLMRSELAEPGLQIVSRNGYAELFTMHGSTMIFLVMIPLALASCAYLAPLQIGARGLAGGRLPHAASWLMIFGGLVMWTSWLSRDGAGRAGWYAYDPLSGSQTTPGSGMDLWLAGVIVATLGQILLAACVLVTILRRRAPGMTLLRLSPFTWTALATMLMVVVSFPSLVIGFGLVLADRHGASILDPISYQQLFWFYGHPAVYVMFFPFIGMVAEAAAVMTGRRFFGYHAFVPAILAFTALATSVWAHHMFTTGAVADKMFALTSTALIVPAGIEYFDVIGTLWRGAVQLTAPTWFAIGFLLQFLLGGISGVMTASPVLDRQFQDSYVVVAHFHYTLFGGSLFGLMAGVYLWWPKVTGRFLSNRLGLWHAGLLALGTTLTFIPQFALGQEGMARRLADYPAAEGWTTLNAISTAGAGVIAVAFILFAVAIARSLRGPRTAEADAWGTGLSLEWAAPSPPPVGNFTAPLPPIRSYAPLLDQREAAARAVAAAEPPGSKEVPA